MREILFRGKLVINNEWAYSRCPDGTLHSGVVKHDFIPATVGQYTGLTDKNGERIFEGDVLIGHDYDEEVGYGVVRWVDGAWEVGNDEWCGTFHDNYWADKYEVIGNIHDNPELLKEEQ